MQCRDQPVLVLGLSNSQSAGVYSRREVAERGVYSHDGELTGGE